MTRYPTETVVHPHKLPNMVKCLISALDAFILAVLLINSCYDNQLHYIIYYVHYTSTFNLGFIDV